MNQEDINEMVNRGNYAMGRTKTADAVELAYGLLWLFHGDARYDSDRRVFEARKVLLALLTQDGQKRGIEAAKRQAFMDAIPVTPTR